MKIYHSHEHTFGFLVHNHLPGHPHVDCKVNVEELQRNSRALRNFDTKENHENTRNLEIEEVMKELRDDYAKGDIYQQIRF
jgi:hypothetical protein